jgi:hypothetical protein
MPFNHRSNNRNNMATRLCLGEKIQRLRAREAEGNLRQDQSNSSWSAYAQELSSLTTQERTRTTCYFLGVFLLTRRLSWFLGAEIVAWVQYARIWVAALPSFLPSCLRLGQVTLLVFYIPGVMSTLVEANYFLDFLVFLAFDIDCASVYSKCAGTFLMTP